MHCHYYESTVCRSCSHLDRTRGQSLEAKAAAIRTLFPEADTQEFVRCDPVAGSRIRAKLAVTGSIDSPHIGFVDEHGAMVEVAQCPLHHELINQWLLQVPEIIRAARLLPYDRATDRGELKFIVVTCSPTDQRLMVQFVLRSREALDRIRGIWRDLAADAGQPVSVLSVNLQPIRSSLINGPEEIPISDATTLPVSFNGLELFCGPQSFIQTNHAVAERLYATVAELLANERAGSVLDLYSGIGAFALSVATPARMVTGVDSSSTAIACARAAADRRGEANVRFHCVSLDRTTSAAEVASLTTTPPDTIICNPPRRGLDGPSLDLILTLAPRVLVYSSCHPQSLARDVQMLQSRYHLRWLRPFDMFPFTHHCEVLAVLDARTGAP